MVQCRHYTDHDTMKMNSAPQFSENPALARTLRAAVKIRIDDLGAGRFRRFDTPDMLVQHLQKLAADILGHDKTAPSVRDASGTQNQSKLF